MRAGLSSIQQTLTPESSNILNQSIAEATRLNHGQTTPLHVAATLLASPTGYLRQACIRSHPNSSHPLQCRALELCFSIALDRLPTAQNGPGSEPPISNALMAALKRAQAHQRRGCPEQQQQPLLAVKVELEQLIISILDDPSVSRVMREASFSSPAVKKTIEQSMNSSSCNSNFNPQNQSMGLIGGIGSTNRSLYLNPRLQQRGGEEVNKLFDIMSRRKKKNPILVGDSEPDAVVKEIFRNIRNNEFGSDIRLFENVDVVSMDKGILLDKNQISDKIKELGMVIEGSLGNGKGVILDLGDLKWLVEQPVGFVSEMGRMVVVEMAKLVARFGGGNKNMFWLIGTATCETYLRCQVYHSTMENDWDLQAVPIASRSPLPGMFPRVLSNPVESLNPLKTVPTPLPALTRPVPENLDPGQRTAFCPQCSANYEKELAKLAAIEKSFSESKQESIRPSLPQWLQNAKLNNTDNKTSDQSQKTQELRKKWKDTCLHLHPNFHQNTVSNRPGQFILSMPSLYNPNLLSRQPFQPKLQTIKPFGEALQLNTDHVTKQPANYASSPLASPVRTDLVLGSKGTQTTPQKATEDFLGSISSTPHTKFAYALDADTYKKLLNCLMEKAWWQAEAATAVASAITRSRGAGSRGDIWLLFAGPDRVGKKKMASVLAEQINRTTPIMICLGTKRDYEDSDMNFRGRTAIDRITEAVLRNPFSVVMLEDIDEADVLVRGCIKRAIERGRLTDSHGREVVLGNAVFILTGDWSTTDPEALRDGHFVDEKKLASVASGEWKLGLIVREKNAKRRVNWLQDGNRPSKPRKEIGSGLSLDLNLSAGDNDDYRTEGSNNSSDLTIDHDEELGLVNRNFSITSVPHDLANIVDDSIMFKPVESDFVRREINKTISVKFSMIVDDNLSIEVEDDVIEKILGGLWHDRTSLEQWIEEVLAPSFDRLKPRLLPSGGGSVVVRLVVESDSGCDRGNSNGNTDWLPSNILV
ncbi:hypothetical protein RD792_012547 [Penstemon davidsonii]|uniref:Clp R domain-containing protein n=1 Tax=Penstemon davidsonii TaxID=160366 RepID=A0ABR0CXJ3_9LAMI|nr:hypothetical protein RD792_012547 [Penstemon davidsonii]